MRAWFYSLLGVGLGRTLLALAQRRARAQRLVGKPVLIMGAGVVGAQVARRLENHPEYGLAPVGFLDEDPRSVAEVGGREVPVLGTIDDLEDAVARTGVRNLIVAFSSVADARVSRLIPRCQELGVDVSVVPRMFDLINDRVGYDTVGGLPLLSFTAIDPKGMQFAVKHALDRVLAAVVLIVLSPLLLASAIAVKLSSPGPVLFKQRRVGRDGRVFDFYKFRSMREPGRGKEDDGDASALDFLLAGDIAPGGVEGDDRRTAVGRFLRGTSLDELPQLFNVLRGDMSLVGPRPERPEFVELFRNDIIRYGDRHRVKSGHHRLGPGARPARADLARRARRVGQLLHRPLVARARPEDPRADVRRAVPQRRLSRSPAARGAQRSRCSCGPRGRTPVQYWKTRTRSPCVPSADGSAQGVFVEAVQREHRAVAQPAALERFEAP